MPRKKAFSTKQKKEQLKQKRQRSERGLQHGHGSQQQTNNQLQSDLDKDISPFSSLRDLDIKKGRKLNNDPDRYKLFFEVDTEEEIENRKIQARKPLVRFSKSDLEFSLEDIYKPGTVLDMPKRPEWDYKMEKRQVEENEEKMFRKYLLELRQEMSMESKLSYFEMNLETWRQLWRVLEVSNIIVIITDVRYPVIHFSPTLYDYVHKDLKKDVIMVLNKIDLIAPEVVVAWKHYFHTRFPELNIVCFTSYPKDPEEIRQMELKVKKGLKRRKKTSFIPVGPRELHHVCDKIMDGKVNLRDWLSHIEKQEKIFNDGLCYDEDDSNDEEQDDSTVEDVETKEGILTIGLVGHPNVGKSSILNGLIGKKVVSCSRTPGHTKHFQTIFLTPSVRLCDCPGLVFPSLVDRRLQILSGTYPIAQVREPYSVVGYLASCIALEKLLDLTHPKIAENDEGEEGEEDLEWSAWDICDAWAELRGYYTAKAGRPDSYRAANSLLRLATQGKIVISLYPPGFLHDKEKWQEALETKEIAKLQQQCSDIKLWKLENSDSSNNNDSTDEEDDEEEVHVTNTFALLMQDD